MICLIWVQTPLGIDDLSFLILVSTQSDKFDLRWICLILVPNHLGKVDLMCICLIWVPTPNPQPQPQVFFLSKVDLYYRGLNSLRQNWFFWICLILYVTFNSDTQLLYNSCLNHSWLSHWWVSDLLKNIIKKNPKHKDIMFHICFWDLFYILNLVKVKIVV